MSIRILAALLISAQFAQARQITFDRSASITGILQSEGADVKVPAVAAQPSVKTADWTIMVYINAKNNLAEFGQKDVNEMEIVGSSDRINVVVELGLMDSADYEDELYSYRKYSDTWTGARRYLIKKDSDTDKITSPVLQKIPVVDMGDWKHLADFGKWAKQKYPASHYMLIVWNHGSGWQKLKPRKGISYDDETGHHITTPELGKALQSIGKVDIYGSDACLMQMAEVDYEIKDYADYIVGSEETESGDGYTYNTFLSKINGASTAVQVGKAAVEAYTAHYASAGEEATQSLVDARQLAQFQQLLDSWTESVKKTPGMKEKIKKARAAAVSFAEKDNKDLYDFLRIAAAGSKDADFAAKTKEVMDFISGKLVILSKTTGAQYAKAKGIAIFIPDYANGFYPELKWAKSGKWDEFIEWTMQE